MLTSVRPLLRGLPSIPRGESALTPLLEFSLLLLSGAVRPLQLWPPLATELMFVTRTRVQRHVLRTVPVLGVSSNALMLSRPAIFSSEALSYREDTINEDAEP